MDSMKNLKWTTKEQCLSAFWLLCGIALAVTTGFQVKTMDASALLEHLGLIALLASWALSPGFFLQPLRAGFGQPIQKPLIVGMLASLVCESLSLLLRYFL